MNIKNIIKTVLVNLIIFIAFLLLLEWIMFLTPNKTDADYIKNYNEYAKKNNIPTVKLGYYPCVEFRYEKAKSLFRPVEIGRLKKTKRPILFFGCSYTQGTLLNDNQTISYKESKETGRTTYNRGFPGAGPQLMLLQLQDKNFYKEVPDAQYIIYTYIGGHMLRMHTYNNCVFPTPDGKYEVNPRYELKNGNLEKVKPKFLFFYRSFLVRKIQNYLQLRKVYNEEKTFDLFLAIMKESKRLTESHYKNPKFVILLYKDSGGGTLDEKQIEKLKSEGFIVLDSEKLVNHELMSAKYRAGDKEHPSEEAWNEITPKLVKALGL